MPKKKYVRPFTAIEITFRGKFSRWEQYQMREAMMTFAGCLRQNIHYARKEAYRKLDLKRRKKKRG